MKNMSRLPLVLVILLSSCLRPSSRPPVPIGDDKSIKFPEFHTQPALKVGKQGGTYQLDGVTLRALMIAANDFTPPEAEDPPCPFRQEAHFYRVIREGDIIFVDVSYNPEHCEPKVFMLDGGARYAISTDGRILRRLIGIEPDGFPRETPHRKSQPVPASMLGSSMAEPNWEGLAPALGPMKHDAGMGAAAPDPSHADGGTRPEARDAGT